jgi:citrate lyase beta subunit
MKTALTAEAVKPIQDRLTAANRQFNGFYPGEPVGHQPVHTVYGGAHLFSSGIVQKFSRTSLDTLEKYAPTSRALSEALVGPGADGRLWATIHERVTHKLRTSPLEDFRIDFEDGYGTRSDEEEDGHAKSAALEVAKEWRAKSLPPFLGIRIKSFSEPCFRRGYRTLDLFLSTLLAETGGKVPDGFVVTLPKVTVAEQPKALADLMALIEKAHGLQAGTLKFEIMVETTQSILDESGRCPLRGFVEASQGRCTAAHLGTYDYTAGHNITAAHQSMAHQACDFAKQMMKVALSGTGVLLSDGATNIMPVGNADTVHKAWRISYGHIRHSLVTGYYQGWDLHPAQLPVRYAAVYSFFLEALTPATERLKGFVEKAARATLLGDVFDDAATGQGLLNFFVRGLSCGALSEEEALATGLTLKEIQGRAFLPILENRSRQTPAR